MLKGQVQRYKLRASDDETPGIIDICNLDSQGSGDSLPYRLIPSTSATGPTLVLHHVASGCPIALLNDREGEEYSVEWLPSTTSFPDLMNGVGTWSKTTFSFSHGRTSTLKVSFTIDGRWFKWKVRPHPDKLAGASLGDWFWLFDVTKNRKEIAKMAIHPNYRTLEFEVQSLPEGVDTLLVASIWLLAERAWTSKQGASKKWQIA
ncbi:hypothetical protein BDK51DRAFT_51312 [Blyttiomyces helicus]|uniref:Uncharacterized protein n=1 Tax=Blyttiomyces helicus TaxID=388810 RepID=A0A4P9W701_9FUNG|nr:hypothetical protein BDK51DRAFT_51312 [Blyttiomyces helicus]|eukprot:RKO85916.1 hypothetical protein BDK51DRAFT_51312 [Blyttiomyces helicus]